MKAVSSSYEGTAEQYIWFKHVVAKVSMHRLTLDRYLKIAIKDGLIAWFGGTDALIITDAGLNYLVVHGIIEE